VKDVLTLRSDVFDAQFLTTWCAV